MKHRVFLSVEDNSKKNKLDRILALDETGEHLFCYEADTRGERENYEEQFVNDRTNSPAAVAFAEFERFCKEECGLKDCNDEVVFSEGARTPHTLADYVDVRLGCVDWAVVKYMDRDYRFETSHLEDPSPFINFWVGTGLGMPEPYAAHRVYQKYREYIHKDSYTEEEICRMEKYISSHLGAVYRRRGGFRAIWQISYPCAAIY